MPRTDGGACRGKASSISTGLPQSAPKSSRLQLEGDGAGDSEAALPHDPSGDLRGSECVGSGGRSERAEREQGGKRCESRVALARKRGEPVPWRGEALLSVGEQGPSLPWPPTNRSLSPGFAPVQPRHSIYVEMVSMEAC